MKTSFVALAFFLAFPLIVTAQNASIRGIHFEVNRSHPAFSITKEKLKQAQTLTGLNKHYKASWVRAYNMVEVLTSHKGQIRKTVSENDILTQQQKQAMNTADIGTAIAVKVRYIPKNNLKHNDIKEMNFTFSVEPENEAQYPGGPQALNQYLQETTINKIPDGIFTGYKMAAVKFSINEKGQVTDTHLFWPSEDEQTDQLLLNAVRKMPNWIPASYTDGTKVKQEFALAIGNKESCVVNLLNFKE